MSDKDPERELQSPYLQAKRVCQRYDVCDRTLDRWLADARIDFPRPLTINGRRYFSEPELVAWERKRAGKAT